jgi:hypothetical protein
MSGILILQSHCENYIEVENLCVRFSKKNEKWTNSKFSFLLE